MAIFQGNIQEFHHFIGPKIRNAINTWTRKHRKEKKGICEFCGKVSELQSAHVHGRDRRTIIEVILAKYTDSMGHISCTIKEAEAEILEAHEPIEKTFKFICHPCHVKYDANDKPQVQKKGMNNSKPSADPEFPKIHKIELWAKRSHQINHKIIKAFLKLENIGEVTFPRLKEYCMQELGIDKFEGHFVSLKTDAGNSHGTIFYEDNGHVKLWNRVRSEINKHFDDDCIL